MTIAIVALVVVALLLALAGTGVYNGLIRTRNLVQEAWAQIDTELKRRHDLIGNLVETVKGYAAHEQGVLEEVTRARAGAVQASQGSADPAGVAQAEAQLSQALVRLSAVAEAYPDLKADRSFLGLQQELTSTEDRIASARRYYNASVRDLNTKVESVPSNVVAGLAGVKKAEYFEVVGQERETVKVDFGTGSQGRLDAPQAPSLGGPQADRVQDAPVQLPQNPPQGQAETPPQA